MMSRALIIIFMGVMVLEIKKNTDWRDMSAKLFCVGFFALFVYIILKYAITAFLPFIIAYLLSLIINPLSSATEKYIGIPRRLCGAVYVTLFIALLLAAAVFGVRRLVLEIEEFILAGEGINKASQMLFAVREKISVLTGGNTVAESLSEYIFGFADNIEKNIVSYAVESLSRLASAVVSRAPSIFIGALVTVMSCYCFCTRDEGFFSEIKKAIPRGYRDRAEKLVGVVGSAIKGYARAYLFLMLITFCEVYVGLVILRVKYAFLIAACVAVVDILPILGAGTVLVPWAIVCIFASQTYLGIGLLILYGVVTVVRQIAEPSVVGASVGLRGAVSLFSMYAGFKLFGFVGMILGPLVAIAVREVIKN